MEQVRKTIQYLVTAVAITFLLGCGEVVSPPQSAGSAAEQGLVVFNTTAACISCHTTNGAGGLPGPDLQGIATRIAPQYPGMIAQEALRESIIDPDAYVVPGYRDDLMPDNYNETLSEEQIANLVVYLLTLE